MSRNGKPSAQDAELVTQIQDGDSEAFGLLYERYVDQIFRYIRSRVSDERDAEDLTESVFLKGYESVHDYEDRGHPYSAFLYQVARNVLVDHYRQASEATSLEDAEPIAADGPDMESRLVDQEQYQIITRAMTSLSEDYQEVIRLRVLLALPTTMAASWLDRSEGATRVLLYRALNSLKEELEKARGTERREAKSRSV